MSFMYRPDIDGLRALAVSGVLLYHLDSVDILPGGFLGVDVFFVISGFLITGVILTSIEDESFSFKKFYLRRAKRLLPTFFVVAFATVAISWLVLSPSRMMDFANSAFFSVFGLSNLYFMFQDPYWADSSDTLPFLHTWSLGVEEQFYLLFPALLVVSSRRFDSRSRIIAFSVLAGLSLLLALFVSSFNPTYAFYLLPTRAWELLVGVVLALAIRRWPIPVPRGIASLGAGFGIVLIAFSYVYLGQFITGPGILTIIPVVGAALVIFGGLTANPVSAVLAVRPLVALGLISYSLYLWHYPVLALGRVNEPLGLAGEILGIGLAVALATATYFTIENPFRRTRHLRPFVAFSSIGLASLLAFTFGSIETSGYEARRGNTLSSQSAVVEPELGDLISVEDLDGTLLLFGDSHMGRLRSSLAEQAGQHGLEFVDGTRPGCPLFEGIDRLGHACTSELQAERLALTAEMEPSFVVLGGRFPLSIESSRFDNMEGGRESGKARDYVLPGLGEPDRDNQKSLVQDALRRAIRSLLAQGHTVVLVYPIPEVGWHAPDEIQVRAEMQLRGNSLHSTIIDKVPLPGKIRERLLPNLVLWPFETAREGSWPLENPVTTSYDVYAARSQSSFEALDSVRSDNIIRVYPHRMLCEERENGRCVTHDDVEVFYMDENHLSPAGAQILTTEIITAISEWNSNR